MALIIRPRNNIFQFKTPLTIPTRTTTPAFIDKGIGITDVVREIPSAAKQVAKDIGQSIARSFVATSKAIVNLSTGRKISDPFIPETRLEKKLVGERPVNFESIGREVAGIIGKSNVISKGYAVPLGIVFAGLDIVPIGFSKTKTVAKTIAKLNKADDIVPVLKQVVKGGDNEIRALAQGLEQVSDPKAIRQIIQKIKETPAVQPLAQEARKYKSAHQISGDTKPASNLVNIDDIVQKHKVTNGYLTKYDQTDLSKLKKMQGNPEMEITIYRTSPVKELNSGDWITTSKTYAQDIKRQNGGKVYEYTAKASELKYPNDITELPSLARFSAFKYEPITQATKAEPLAQEARKLGEVSPLKMAGETGRTFQDLLKDSPAMLKGRTGFTIPPKTVTIYKGVSKSGLPIKTGDWVTTNKGYAKQFGKVLEKLEVPAEELRYMRGAFKGNAIGEYPEYILTQATKGVEKIAPKIAPQDPVSVLNEALIKAKPARGRLGKIFTAERSKRIAKVEQIIDKAEGEKGYAQALSKLKGELTGKAKTHFEPIKKKLTQTQVDDLYNKTFQHPYLDNWEKINASNALTDLLRGKIPTSKQLELLEEIYGSDLIKNILKKRALGAKVTDLLVEIANIPRAILATGELSGFLRQGVIEAAAHPIKSLRAMKETFKFVFRPKTFEKFFKDLPKDPLYPLMRKSKLAITDPARVGPSNREEAFISQLLQKTPGIGIVIRAAERGYVGFLNKLRVDIFKEWADELLTKGLSPVKDKEIFRSAARVINTFTGRGDMGKLNRITPHLNVLFFSPRLITARFNALNPVWYMRQPKEIRKKAIGDFAKFVGVGLTTLGLIKLAKGDDVDIETNPRSSDFGKVRIGNTRFDIWGGFQQWVRVFAQIITGERKNTTTGEIISLTKDEYPFTTRKEVALRFIEGKFAPIPALLNQLISGAKTFEGEKLTPSIVAKEKLIPMYIQDIAEAYQEGGLGRSIGAGAAAFFGVGVQTWREKQKTEKTPLKDIFKTQGKRKSLKDIFK